VQTGEGGEELVYDNAFLMAYMPSTRLGDRVFNTMKAAFEKGVLTEVVQLTRTTAKVMFRIEVKTDPSGE
jgi:hypothetical protein